MISLLFLWKILTLPVKVCVTIIQFYTLGTIYSKTSPEFRNNLRKNITITIKHHFVESYSKKDLRYFVNTSVENIMNNYKANSMISNANLNGYNQAYSKNSCWLVKAKNSIPYCNQNVLILLHGGGYAVSMLNEHLLGILVVYHSLPIAIKDKLSILVIDYSLTVDGHIFPTQIIETLQVYQKLASHGYSSISFIGDSAGANLALSVSRVIAYPKEFIEQLDSFSGYSNFKFENLPQPESLILLSPWVEPTIKPTNFNENITYGDLCSKYNTLGNWYIEGMDIRNIESYINFSKTNYEEHWSNVDPISKPRRTLIIYGEREILREGIEKWINIVNVSNTVIYKIEKGGIHDCMYFVESQDYLGQKGATKGFSGINSTNFCINLVSRFLIERMNVSLENEVTS